MVIVVVCRVVLVEFNTLFLQYVKKVEKLAAGRYDLTEPYSHRISSFRVPFVIPRADENSSPGTSKVVILSDPIQGRKDVRMAVRKPYLKGRSNGKSANTLNSWSSHVESKRGRKFM